MNIVLIFGYQVLLRNMEKLQETLAKPIIIIIINIIIIIATMILIT